MKTKSLTSSERDFLELIAGAAFANPFGKNRVELDLKISGLTHKASDMERLSAVSGKVRNFIIKLEKAGKNRINDYSGHDRSTIEIANLFDVFHRFFEKFDHLIEKQVTTEDHSCTVPFAQDILKELAARGFARNETRRYLAMFYQLRRAFYFIDVALIGRSTSMQQLRRALWNNVFTHDIRLYDQHLWNRMEDFSTLLLGETGTGKGTAATAIGRSGFIPFDEKKGRFTESFMKSFVSINLSQYPETLIESELFGHRKGAFTGAVDAYEGIFSRCSLHGAIFLDEIGDVTIPVQIKLLQILQERTFSPVGSHEKQRFNGRVIAASNKSIEKLRHDKLFRDDFFYRLCSDVITVPSLQQRIQEDPKELNELLNVTIERTVGHKSPELIEMVSEVIRRELGTDYPWPGNVRELEQCVRRTLLTRSYKGDQSSISPDLRSKILNQIDAGTYTAQNLLADYCSLLYNRHGTYEEVAKRSGLDRRTVKKYIASHNKDSGQ
ncbi:sigma-54-dependent transcriptional regulator [Verrucomicrobiota bacterium]